MRVGRHAAACNNNYYNIILIDLIMLIMIRYGNVENHRRACVYNAAARDGEPPGDGRGTRVIGKKKKKNFY